MQLSFQISSQLTSDLDREHLSDALGEAFRTHGVSPRTDAYVARLTPGAEWMFFNHDSEKGLTGLYLIVTAGDGGLRVYVLWRTLRLEPTWENAMDAQEPSSALIRQLQGLGVMLGSRTSIRRRKPVPARRSLVERVRTRELPIVPTWILSDPESGQQVGVWKVGDQLWAAWLTFSNEGPLLVQHRIFWNGLYGLQKGEAKDDQLLISGWERTRLKDERQRRKWDYFFPPMVDQLSLSRRIGRRKVTAGILDDWSRQGYAAAGLWTVYGVAFAFLGRDVRAAAVLLAAGLLLLFRDTVLRLLSSEDAAGVARPRRTISEDRAVLRDTGGIEVRTQVLTNYFKPTPGTHVEPRTWVNAVLADLKELRRIGLAVPAAATVCVAGVLLFSDVDWRPGYAAAVLLAITLAGDELTSWLTLHHMRTGRWSALPVGAAQAVAALVLLAAGAAAGGLFPLAAFPALALCMAGRVWMLQRFRRQLDTERGFLQGELDALLRQVPDDVPTDAEIDGWLEDELRELDKRSIAELHIDPDQLTPVDGRLLQTLPHEEHVVCALDAGRLPPEVTAAARHHGVYLGQAPVALREGRQWAFADGNCVLTHKQGALHLYQGEDLNPLDLGGVVILGWGLVQPQDAFGKDKLVRDYWHSLSAWKVGGDGRLRHAVYYVQFLYFTEQMVAASGFFYNFIKGPRGGRERAANMEYPYRFVVGVQDQPEKNDSLDQLLADPKRSLETTLFQLQVTNGQSIRIALTDEFVLKHLKEGLRKRATTNGGDGREEATRAGASVAAANPRSFLDAEEEDTDAVRSKAVINFVKREWRSHGRQPA